MWGCPLGSDRAALNSFVSSDSAASPKASQSQGRPRYQPPPHVLRTQQALSCFLPGGASPHPQPLQGSLTASPSLRPVGMSGPLLRSFCPLPPYLITLPPG